MARVTALSIKGAWLVEAPVHHDNRGHFQEWFKESLMLEAIGREIRCGSSKHLEVQKGCRAGHTRHVNRHSDRPSGLLAPMALSGM